MFRRFVLVSALAFAGCGIPERDNVLDPAVRPIPAISVTVNFEPGTVGGRNEIWILDASASESPGGDLSFEWAMADAATLDPADPTLEWIVVGSEARLESNPALAPDSPFHLALNAITDFQGGSSAGTGATSRLVQVTVESDGAESTIFVPLTIVNQAPLVELGPDYRIAPGGMWWKPTANGPLDAEPWPVEIVADVRDPDPGDGQFAFDASRPLRWRVRGALAVALDADGDGFVDDGFFDGADLAHRVLRFDAPLAPSLNEFEVFADDVGVPDLIPEGSLRVDVRASHWAFDRLTGQLGRLDTAMFFATQDPVEYLYPIASDGTHVLASVSAGTSSSLVLLEANLEEIARVPNDPGVFLGPGVADGAGGFWIFENDFPFRGLVRAVPDQIGGFTFSASVSDADGDANDDFDDGAFDQIAPATGGDVWVIGNAGTRVFRLADDGSLVASAISFPATPSQAAEALAPDGNGGVWVAGKSLAHLDAAGAHIAADEIASLHDDITARYADLDLRTGTLWVALPEDLVRRTVDGDLLSIHEGVKSMSVQPDSTLLGVFFDQALAPVLERFDPETLDIVETIAPGLSMYELVTLDGGSVLVTGYDPETLIEGLLWIEAGALDEPVVADLAVSGLVYDSLPFAVDPARGDLWVWREDRGVAERYSADGVFLQSVDPGLGDVTQGGGIAIDGETRQVWVAWGYVGTNFMTQTFGQLGSFTVPRDPQEQVYVEVEPSPQIPMAFNSVESLAVTREDRRICAGAHPVFDDAIWPQQFNDGGFAFDALTDTVLLQTTSDTIFAGLVEFLPASDPVRNSCAFLPVDGGAYRRGHYLAGDGTDTFVEPVTSALTRGLVIDPADGAIWYSEEVDDSTTWLWRFDPAVDLAPVSITPVLTTVTPLRFAGSLTVDPFYGHLFAGFSNQTSGGYVLRLDRRSVEVARDGSIGYPRLTAGY